MLFGGTFDRYSLSGMSEKGGRGSKSPSCLSFVGAEMPFLKCNRLLYKCLDDAAENIVCFLIISYLVGKEENLYDCGKYSMETTMESMTLCILYFRLPYLTFSNFTKHKSHTLVKCHCKNLEIKVIFSSFKIKNLMNFKDFVPQSLCLSVIYEFSYAGCNPVYVGETSQHLSTFMHEHL